MYEHSFTTTLNEQSHRNVVRSERTIVTDCVALD